MAMKVYGASTKGVRNGSMGFDDATLEPTYELRLGAPGKSAGLDIASRLGLDPHLIAIARSPINNVELDFPRLLRNPTLRPDMPQRRKSTQQKFANWNSAPPPSPSSSSSVPNRPSAS
jgi:dsDNA-specific endonuclease/ATPase MutS2